VPMAPVACPECTAIAFEQIFDQACRAQIHNDKSSLYGMWHPQFGMVLKSYEHKREIMKRWGLDEASDSVKGNRQHFSEMANSDGGQPEPGDGGLEWGAWEDVKEKQKAHKTSRLGQDGKVKLA